MKDKTTSQQNSNGALDFTTKLFSPPHLVSRSIANKKYVLLDPDKPFWITVNKTGKEIIECFDGGRDIETIAKIFGGRYKKPLQKASSEILPFLEEIYQKQFLSKVPFHSSELQDRSASKLVELWIHITNGCNLRCIHCHVSSSMPLENELMKEEFFRVIDSFANAGGRKIIYSGGEPLLREICLDVIEYGYKKRIQEQTLITNGILITDSIAQRLKELQVNVQLSLDGARAGTNDRIRGRGSYDKAIEGLKKLIKAGVKAHIAMTIMKINISEIMDMARLSQDLGLKRIHFPFLQMKGRARAQKVPLALSFKDHLMAREIISRIQREIGIRVSFDEAFRMSARIMKRRDFCGAGAGMLSVDSDGNVYPCAGLHEEQFKAGKIRERNLEDIHRDASVLQEFRKLSVVQVKECRSCELKFICGGGCHVDTYQAYGRLNKPTPRCRMLKAIHWKILKEVGKETLHGRR